MASSELPPDSDRDASNLRRRLLTTPPAADDSTAPASPEPDPRQSLPRGVLQRLSGTRKTEDALGSSSESSPPPGLQDTPTPNIDFMRPPARREPPRPAAAPPAATPPMSPPMQPPATPMRSMTPQPPVSAAATDLNLAAAFPEIQIGEHTEADLLRRENIELMAAIEEARLLLQEAAQMETDFQAREQTYQSQINELQELFASKQTEFETLQQQLELIEQSIAAGGLAPATNPVVMPPPPPKTRTELEEWADELERESAKLNQERRKLEQERLQLREDETALEKQMRDMEVQMARDRASIARQEIELKRLSAEIQHDLEMMQRGDATLREQLAKFQRRHQDVMSRGGVQPMPPGGMPPGAMPPGGMPPGGMPGAPAQPPPSEPTKDSGVMRRFFRRS
ncbi:hypothetical protein [Tuwongella immobilis]|uniref:Uncharacterized protein n=1 Tax=Tuwongella immobilis TaxID=692036 RepID=A0A6C2YRJ1_9BACT|nr:hypothetical protein [Tuwongella immobilis]VIP04280.1 unnamed protein product [Tuwongella immobilis]VTS05923.1 unnamed protein product [Tuwongella immobilis]